MQDSEDRVRRFILERIPFFAYEKYYKAFFLGKTDTTLSVWINVFISDWKTFQEETNATSSLSKKIDQFVEMLISFTGNFKGIYEIDRPSTMGREDWIAIVKFAKNICN